jgi:hypothetical protein
LLLALTQLFGIAMGLPERLHAVVQEGLAARITIRLLFEPLQALQ